jgi:hypothetical protein
MSKAKIPDGALALEKYLEVGLFKLGEAAPTRREVRCPYCHLEFEQRMGGESIVRPGCPDCGYPRSFRKKLERLRAGGGER